MLIHRHASPDPHQLKTSSEDDVFLKPNKRQIENEYFTRRCKLCSDFNVHVVGENEIRIQ